MVLFRILSVAAAFFVLMATIWLFPVGADSHCQTVTLGRGWADRIGEGRIVMRNTGQPCGAAILADPDANLYVDAIRVTAPPQNGTVTVDVPRFLYTPNQGFTGRDRFELTAEGRRRDGRRALLGGAVTVQVNP